MNYEKQILAHAAEVWGLTEAEMCAPGRRVLTVNARDQAACLLKEVCDYPTRVIAELLGRAHPGTAGAAIRRFPARYETEPEFRAKFWEVRHRLGLPKMRPEDAA